MGQGFTTFTAGNVLTASEVNNYLMEQSVMVFATTGARDSAIITPEAGMTAYINSGDSSEGLYSYTGTTWNKGPSWNAPWGLLSKAVLTTNSVTSATHTTQQDGSAPITLTATTITNRIYRVTSTHQPNTNGTAGDYIGFVPVIGGVSQTAYQYSPNSTSIINSVAFSFTYTETAGASRIFKIQIKSNLTNTQVTDYGLAPFSRTLVVEDIGPSGAPN